MGRSDVQELRLSGALSEPVGGVLSSGGARPARAGASRMASHTRVQDVRTAPSRPSKKHDAGLQRGGRWPEGGGPISRPCRCEYHGRSWLSSSRMKVVGRGVAEVLGVWLGRAGGEGAPPDAA